MADQMFGYQRMVLFIPIVQIVVAASEDAEQDSITKNEYQGRQVFSLLAIYGSENAGCQATEECKNTKDQIIHSIQIKPFELFKDNLLK